MLRFDPHFDREKLYESAALMKIVWKGPKTVADMSDIKASLSGGKLLSS